MKGAGILLEGDFDWFIFLLRFALLCPVFPSRCLQGRCDC